MSKEGEREKGAVFVWRKKKLVLLFWFCFFIVAFCDDGGRYSGVLCIPAMRLILCGSYFLIPSEEMELIKVGYMIDFKTTTSTTTSTITAPDAF